MNNTTLKEDFWQMGLLLSAEGENHKISVQLLNFAVCEYFSYYCCYYY